MSDRRELYRSPNGDSWFLGREPSNGHALIIHQPMPHLAADCRTLSWASSCVAEMDQSSRHYSA
jgi:hypothetical protein